MKIPLIEDRTELLRWALSGAAVVFLHGAVAAAMINWNEESASEPTAALVVDLAPIPTAPPESVANLPPGPVQADSEASPHVAVKEVKEEVEERPETDPSREEVLPELARAANPEVPLDTTPPKPEQTAEVPQEAQLQSEASAPPPMPEAAPAEVAAAPVRGPPSVDRSNAIPTWRGAVAALIERNKRYPADAKNARGIAQVAFILDRKGRVMSSHIAMTSGSLALDRAALEVIKRAQPFPPPPASMPDADLSLRVRLLFNME